MNESTEAPKKKRAGRSPGYPAIDVETALRRAEELYDKAQHRPSHTNVAAGHWGYKPGSGATSTTIAALIKYGFLAAEGTGKDRSVRLTDLALDIIKDKRTDSTERNERIKQAALRPKIHDEMHEKYGFDLKISNENLLYDLEREKKFTPNGAKEFIAQYRSTLKYISGLKYDAAPPVEDVSEGQTDRLTPEDQSSESSGTAVDAVAPSKGANVQAIKIPMPPMPEEVWPTLTAPVSNGRGRLEVYDRCFGSNAV